MKGSKLQVSTSEAGTSAPAAGGAQGDIKIYIYIDL